MRHSKDNHDCRETPLSWASELIPHSVEKILQLKAVDVERPQTPLLEENGVVIAAFPFCYLLLVLLEGNGVRIIAFLFCYSLLGQ